MISSPPKAITRLIDAVPFNDRTFAGMIKRASARGDKIYLTAPGSMLTYSQLPSEVARTAGALQDIGATPGSRVAILLNNSVEFVLGWWGAIWAGSIGCLIHREFKGPILERTFHMLQPTVVITESSLYENLRPLLSNMPFLKSVVLTDEWTAGADPEPTPVWSWQAIRAAAKEVGPAPTHATDDATIMLTSGSTGPSKAVRKSQHFEFIYSALAAEGIEMDETAHLWSASPCSHVRTANCLLLGALIVGGRVTLGTRFSPSRFWQDIKTAGATHTYMSNWMANLLMKAPPSADDRNSGVKVIHCMPQPADPVGFAERFGIRLTGQGYGSTECYPMPQQLEQQDFTKPPTFLGKPHPLMEVIVANENGFALPPGGKFVGEILVRPRIPHAIFSGYYGDPEATCHVFRDLWFHTGDSATMDAEGNLYFMGRISDSIRRRGENISAWEIEQLVLAYEGIAEAAAYAAVDRFGEQEVKLDVVYDKGAYIEPAALLDYLATQLPRFMVPRYVEIKDALPKSPTGKIERYVLRAQPMGPDVYDRDTFRQQRSKEA
jgi:crotonobetaine/carnitine-CoA ligase